MDESNKHKAIRAKEISEKMFDTGDVYAAMRFACMARNLSPGLEGIEQMIKIFGIHLAAKIKINGEIDWYTILGVVAQDDVATMRESYMSLASLIYSEGNKFVGADGAFELVSQAWSVLSDKAKRATFDEKVKPPTFDKEVKAEETCKLATECEYPPSREGDNCDHNVTEAATSNAKIQKENSPASRSSTFWTICRRCKLVFLYPRVNVNRRLLCFVCNQEFMAVELDRRKLLSARRRSKSFTVNPQAHDASNFHGSTLLRKTCQGSSATQDVQQMYQKVKRKRNEEQATKRENASQEEHPVAKRSHFNPSKIRSALEDMSLTGCDERNSKEPDFKYSGISQAKESCIAKGIYQVELRNHFMDIAVNALSTKLAALNPDTNDSQKVNETGETFLRESDSCDQDNCEKPEERTSRLQATMPSAGSNTTTDMLTKSLGKMSIEFPTSK